MSKKKWTKNKKGFTLVEILVVISIISFISSSSFYYYQDAVKKGRDAKRIANMEIMRSALDLYYDKYNKYPVPVIATAGKCDSSVGITNCSAAESAGNDWDQTINGLYRIATENIGTPPKDPTNNEFHNIKYKTCASGQSYILETILESTPRLYATGKGNYYLAFTADTDGDCLVTLMDYARYMACKNQPVTANCLWTDFNQSGGKTNNSDYNYWLKYYRLDIDTGIFG